MKSLFLKSKSENEKRSPVNLADANYHINYIGAQSLQEVDCFFGIIDITNDISAAVVQVYPAGTLSMMRSGKAIKITGKKEAIIEVSQEAKYDYKEIGMWSKWPEPQKVPFLKIESYEQLSKDLPDVPCKFVFLETPPFAEIRFEDKSVFSFFRNKLLNRTTITGDTIFLQIAGNKLPFPVAYTYPEETVKIDENTFISFLIESNQTTKLYPTFIVTDHTLRIFPIPPEEFMQKTPNRYKDLFQVGYSKSEKQTTLIQDHTDLNLALNAIR